MAVIVGACLTLLGLWRGRATVAMLLRSRWRRMVSPRPVILPAAYPFENYLNVGIGIMWTIGFVLIVPLTLISLTKLNEIFHVVLGRRPKRLIDAMGARPMTRSLPKISIHIPAYREQPQMLIQTLNGMAALDYPNFEVIVIVNNTPEAEYSAPVAEHCERLGPRFKFLDIVVKGFKAGALNAALEHTADDAEIIALIDADYVVLPNWLSDLAPLFDDPQVALVQAPQDHRDGPESPVQDGDEQRIRRLLRRRHGPAERRQRHHSAWNHVPDSAHRPLERSAAGAPRPSSRTPNSACASWKRDIWPITPTPATGVACCRIPSRPSRHSASAGPTAPCRSSASIGLTCCPAQNR